MIARWPERVGAGSESGHISAFWDVMPTVAELVGVSISDTLDGISFLPTLTGKGEQEEHDFLYWEFHEKGGRIELPGWASGKASNMMYRKSPTNR